MAEQSGASLPVQSDLVRGVITAVISSTSFLTTIKGYGDTLFRDWDVFLARDAGGLGAAPQGDRVPCNSYISATGAITIDRPFDTATPDVGDVIFLMFPFLGENTLIIDVPSNDLKQSSDAEVTTAAAGLTEVKSLAWTGSVGGCRVKFDMKIVPGGGTASAVVYKNGVAVTTNPAATPIYTVHTSVSGTYATYSQDIYGLSTGDLIQLYCMAAGGTTYIQNFRICYDILYLPAVRATLDVVYYDQANGYAGTTWPIGTAEQPSNNYTDLMAIAAARNIFKVKIIGGGTFAITTNFTMAIDGSPYCAITVDPLLSVYVLSDLYCFSLSGTAGNFRVFGDLEVVSTITYLAGVTFIVLGDTRAHGAISFPGAGYFVGLYGKASFYSTVTLAGTGQFACADSEFYDNFTSTTSGIVGLYSDVSCTGNFLDAGLGAITVYGDLQVAGTTQVSLNGGLLHVKGDAQLVGAVTTLVAGAVITIDGYGDLWGVITNNGTLTYHVRPIGTMLTLQETGGTLTADGTEQNIVINNAPVAVFNPRKVKIDLDNMIATDTIVVKLYERLSAAGTLKLSDVPVTYTGIDGGLTGGQTQITIDLDANRYGFKVTLEQTAHVAYKDYVWEYFVES